MEKVITKKEIIAILDRVRDLKTVTAEGGNWVIEEKDIPEKMHVDIRPEQETKYLIWSIEHDAWWMPDHNGYTKNRAEAGMYPFEEALKIVKDANRSSTDKPNEAMIEI